MAQPLVHLVQHSPAGCLVVHKPPAVPFHATADQPGILQLIRSQQGQPHLPYTGQLWPVHRLDYICSGALLLATSREAAGELVRRFRQRQVAKYYVALSDRRPAKKMGSVVGEMAKGRRGSWLLTRGGADPAVTRFTTAGVPGRRPGMRAFLLKPETGRTHQIRVAMKSLGAPVLGDQRYAAKEAAVLEERGYLHCAAMRFELQGQLVQVVCRPAHGPEFQCPEFQQLFSGWFPPGLEADEGPWFADSKLLRSQFGTAAALEAAAAAAAAADGWQGA